MKLFIFLFVLLGCSLTKNTTKTISTTGSVVTDNSIQQQKVLYAQECFEDLKREMVIGEGEYLEILGAVSYTHLTLPTKRIV